MPETFDSHQPIMPAPHFSTSMQQKSASGPHFFSPPPQLEQQEQCGQQERQRQPEQREQQKKNKTLHRIAEVRKAQGMSLTNMARHLNIEISAARAQENPNSDLLLSQLYQWQELLDVPVTELLIDPDDLSNNPIRFRATLVRIMKTARTILEKTHESSTRYLAQTLFDQLIEIMPELKEIPAWPNIGQSREHKDYGQAMYRRFDQSVEQSMSEESTS